MMNRQGLVRLSLLLIIVGCSLILVKAAEANGVEQAKTGIVRGAMLYDRWYAVTGKQPPTGNMPLWSLQKTNTLSGPDTWRCVTCHGWDYKGKDGAYGAGSNFTGFPGVLSAGKNKSSAEILSALKNPTNKNHDFSSYLDDASLNDLSVFIKEGLVDDSEFIDPITLKVKGGDSSKGKDLYTKVCASCHGADGKKIALKLDGRDAALGTMAVLDPWRFLHKTRFGTPGTQMAIGFDLGWTAQDGRDVLLFAQQLPSGVEIPALTPALQGREGQSGSQTGGPANNLFTGILTALGAVATSLGFAALLGAFLVGLIFLIVWLIRGRNQ